MKNSNMKLLASTFAVLIIAVLLSSCFMQNSVSIANADITPAAIDVTTTGWDSESGNYSKTRYSEGGGPDSPDLLWSVTLPGVSGQVPVAFNGLVFVKNSTTMFALKYDTGAVVWTSKVPGVPSIQGTAIGSAWKINNDYMMSGQTLLRISDGSVVWQANTSVPWPIDTGSQGLWACQGYVPELKIAFGAGQVWNMSDLTKPPTLLWQLVPSEEGMGSGVCYGDGKIFLGSEMGWQSAYDALTGKLLWKTYTKGEMGYDSLYYQHMLIRGGTVDNTMYAFDADSGRILWTYDTNDWYAFWDHVSAGYGMIYAINQDRDTYAINATTGKMVWKYDGPGIYYQGSVLVGGGKVYAQTGQPQGMDRLTGIPTGITEYMCLDAYTGYPVWYDNLYITNSGAGNDANVLAYGNYYCVPMANQGVTVSNQVWCLGESKDWAMFRDDAAHTASGQSGPHNLVVQWKYNTGAPLIGSPVVSNGKLYEGSEDGWLHCINATTGAFYWKFQINQMMRSTPAVVNGKVYIGPDDGNVYCLDANTGQKLWSYNAGYMTVVSRVKPPLRSSPMVVDGKLYVGTLGNATICLNADTGALIWSFAMPGYVTSSPCVTNGAVYSICYFAAPNAPTNTAGNATLYKINALTGTLMRTYNIPLGIGTAGSAVIGRGEIWASPTVADGMIFMPAQAWKIYGINETTGNIQWTYTIPDSVFATASMTYVAATGRVYFASRFNEICADAFNGTQYWSTYEGREIFSSAAYADGKIYQQTDSRLVYCLDAKTGAKLSWYELDSEAWASPAVWHNKLYVGCLDNNIYCFGDYAPYVKPKALTLASQESNPTLVQAPASASVTEQLVSPAFPMNAAFAIVAAAIAAIATAIMIKKRSK